MTSQIKGDIFKVKCSTRMFTERIKREMRPGKISIQLWGTLSRISSVLGNEVSLPFYMGMWKLEVGFHSKFSYKLCGSVHP